MRDGIIGDTRHWFIRVESWDSHGSIVPYTLIVEFSILCSVLGLFIFCRYGPISLHIFREYGYNDKSSSQLQFRNP